MTKENRKKWYEEWKATGKHPEYEVYGKEFEVKEEEEQLKIKKAKKKEEISKETQPPKSKEKNK